MKKSNRNKTQKAIVLSFEDSPIGIINRNDIYQHCNNRDIEISQFIYFDRAYDADTLINLIEVINSHDIPPMLIMKSSSYVLSSQVLLCCILAVFDYLKAINIYYYCDYDRKNLKPARSVGENSSLYLRVAEMNFYRLWSLAGIHRK